MKLLWDKTWKQMEVADEKFTEFLEKGTLSVSSLKAAQPFIKEWNAFKKKMEELDNYITPVEPIEVELPFGDELFAMCWKTWKEYLQEQHGQMVRSRSEQASLQHLQEISGGNTDKAIKILRYAMHCRYRSFFEINENTSKNPPKDNRMETVLSINEIYQRAERERLRTKAMIDSRTQAITPEDFRKIFIQRAELVMIKRGQECEYIIDEKNKPTLNLLYCRATKQNTEIINPHIGVVLAGAYGCGKSVMIEAYCMVLNDLRSREEDKIEFIHAIDLAYNIKENGIYPWIRKPLLIHDIGKEFQLAKDFGTNLKPLSDLFAVRAEIGTPTFGDTNFDLQMIGDKYDAYIQKRFTEFVNLIILPGDSRRVEKIIK